MNTAIRVALIGCGDFAMGMHIPNLLRNPKYRVVAVADIDEEAARRGADATSAELCTTDISEVLRSSGIDAVFVTTRHNSHAEISITAAEAGKHVFCEKPMGLNADECAAVAAAVTRNRVKYCVGYNRGLAPLVEKAAELLRPVSRPRMIYHRIQAPFPEEHWIHDVRVGGGRIIGEGCHVFDLMCELVESPPVSVYAAGGTYLNPEVVQTADSAAVTIGFADGSVGTTMIMSAGCSNFPKEVTEVYSDGRVVYIHDFRKMEYYGFEGHDRVTIELDSVDKGQAIEIDRFADALLIGSESPNGLAKAGRAAIISFKVLESLDRKSAVAISEDEYSY